MRLAPILALLSACSDPRVRDEAVPAPQPAPAPWPRPPSGPFVHHDRVPTGDNLRAIWRIAADDVWAVGDGRALLHWDGSAWSIASEPRDGCGFQEVWASAHDDVWVSHCRHRGAPRDPYDLDNRPISDAMLHWDGARWSEVPLPALGGRRVAGIHGSGRNDVWLTTDFASLRGDRSSGPPGGGAPAQVLHWDGVRWTPYEIRSTYRAFSPWAASPTDAWLLADGARGAELWRWDGKRWARNTELREASGLWVADGELWVWSHDELRHRLRDGRWASSPASVPSSVYVGQTPWAHTTSGLAHWSGGRWVAATISARIDLTAVGGAADDAWAFGSIDGRRAAFHFDGARWTPLANPFAGDARRLAFAAPDDGWALSVASFEPYRAELVHWNSAAWVGASPPFAPRQVAVSPDGQVWIASGREVAVGDGRSWRTLPAPPFEVDALWARAASDVWIGGRGTARWDGGAWTVISLAPVFEGLARVAPRAGSGPDDVWATALGRRGATYFSGILHWDGQAWSRVELPGDLQMDRDTGRPCEVNTMWSPGPDEVWAVGRCSRENDPLILHRDRSGWTRTLLHVEDLRQGVPWGVRATGALNAVWGRGRDDVWAAGDLGLVLHFDGSSWSRIATDSRDRRAIRALAGAPGGPLWLAGEAGALVSLAADAQVAPVTAPPVRCAAAPAILPGWWTLGDAGCPPGAIIQREDQPLRYEIGCRTPLGIRHGPSITFERPSRSEVAPRRVLEGAYVDGVEQGVWTQWAPSGTKIEERGRCGPMSHGRFARWSARGRLLVEGAFVRDVPDGAFRAWAANGRELAGSTITGGNGHMIWWNEDGTVQSEGDYLDGRKQGPWIERGYDDERGPYDRGLREGVWRIERRGGSTLQTEYHRGVRDGVAIARDRFGRVTRARFANEVYLGPR